MTEQRYPFHRVEALAWHLYIESYDMGDPVTQARVTARWTGDFRESAQIRAGHRKRARELLDAAAHGPMPPTPERVDRIEKVVDQLRMELAARRDTVDPQLVETVQRMIDLYDGKLGSDRADS